jgi:threonine synthase
MGFYCCPQTGAALAVLCKLVERRVIKPSDRVVVISTAHGLKFTRFKVGYHDGELDGVEPHHANPPVELSPRHDVVRRAIDQALGR